MDNNIVPAVVEKVLAVKMSNLRELAEQVVAFSHYSSVNHKEMFFFTANYSTFIQKLFKNQFPLCNCPKVYKFKKVSFTTVRELHQLYTLISQ